MAASDTNTPTFVVYVLAIYALLAPMLLFIEINVIEGSVQIGLEAGIWGVTIYSNTIPPIFFHISSGILFAFLRFVFVWSMFRNYQGLSTRRTTLILGVLADFYLGALILPSLFLGSVASPYIMYLIPLPLMLPARYLVYRMIPLKVPDKVWDE